MSASLTLYRFAKLADKGVVEAADPTVSSRAAHGERVFTRLKL